MQKLLFALISVLIISCGSKAKKEMPPQASSAKIIAVVLGKDSTRHLDVVLRVIKKTIVTDSVKGSDKIVIDTIYGTPVFLPLVDSTGKPVLDKSGQQMISTQPAYFPISKDSINTRVENIPVDSLCKSNKKGV